MLALEIAAALVLLGVSGWLLRFLWLAAGAEPAGGALVEPQAVERPKASLAADRAA